MESIATKPSTSDRQFCSVLGSAAKWRGGNHNESQWWNIITIKHILPLCPTWGIVCSSLNSSIKSLSPQSRSKHPQSQISHQCHGWFGAFTSQVKNEEHAHFSFSSSSLTRFSLWYMFLLCLILCCRFRHRGASTVRLSGSFCSVTTQALDGQQDFCIKKWCSLRHDWSEATA